MHPGATHIALLAAVVARSKGSVLELGCGDFSTPLLHLLCKPPRVLVSVDNDAAWVDRFLDLDTAYHAVRRVERWEDTFEMRVTREGQWDVAFVDCAPAEARVPLIEQLLGRAKQIVIHDTEHPLYGYERIWSHFKYRYDDKRMTPWTTVVSNEIAFVP
jgi:predicted O-methyltransferase YrrM